MEKEYWLSEFLETDKEWRERILKMTKTSVTQMGRILSLVFVDFLYEREDEDISMIFSRVRESLEPNIKPDHKLVVFDIIFALLETGEKVLRDRDKTLNLRNKAVLEERTRLITPQQQFIESTIGELCDQIIFFENMVRLVLSQVVASETVTGNFSQCEDRLIAVDSDVNYRIERLSSLKDDSEIGDDEDGVELLESLMKAKVEELWSEFELYQKE